MSCRKKTQLKPLKSVHFVFDLEKSNKYAYLIYQIHLYIDRPQDQLNQSITFKGGRFSDIETLLMAKNGVTPKYPPPQLNESNDFSW